jgi:hypothetical protein
MGFVERAFTPPGTGGMEAAAQQAAANAANAAKVQQLAPVPQTPSAPEAPAPPKGPQQFSPGQAPGAKQRAQITASSMLGAAATGGQTSKKTLLGA